MLTFEIVNPSDQYTIEAVDMEIAAAACVILGKGKLAFEPIGEGEEIPLFLFAGMDEWFREHFGRDVVSTLTHCRENRRSALAACFDSCLIGGIHDRTAYYKGLELIDDPQKRQQWWAHWHDQRRTSLNDIGQSAKDIAKQLLTA